MDGALEGGMAPRPRQRRAVGVVRALPTLLLCDLLKPGGLWVWEVGPASPRPSCAFADTSSSILPIAVGTVFSLLGLILMGAVSRRLWKRLKSHYDMS